MTSGVYLLHFTDAEGVTSRFKHAGHYIGYSDDLLYRLRHHRTGTGANLLRHVIESGRSFVIARTWPGQSRSFERQLKNRKQAPRLCPICRAEKERATMEEVCWEGQIEVLLQVRGKLNLQGYAETSGAQATEQEIARARADALRRGIESLQTGEVPAIGDVLQYAVDEVEYVKGSGVPYPGTLVEHVYNPATGTYQQVEQEDSVDAVIQAQAENFQSRVASER